MSRRPKDLSEYHGHHVIDGEELRAQFERDTAARRRWWTFRRVRHGIMLILLVALVVVGVGGAFAVLGGYLKIPQPGAAPSPSPTCPAGPFDYAAPDSVRVRVLNATGKEGLAKGVADQLAQRKFVVGSVDNSKAAGSAAAVVVAGPAGESGAFTLQRNVPGSVFMPDGRGDATVDLVLLPTFKDLRDPGLVDQTPGPLVCSLASPSPAPTPAK
ncbi:LytR C-terminal domain-containing protein [Sinomonas sp. ASV322]|uniref:LytR C-terminal domain-containing protein n=1 Tax=Sinomonas sp. ASV322 TaxID=3041920 RepID=UPI0027DB413A|nr:LytR C-terminal domain-containing protein [Sinomonas sp. ASV322]MDQ4502952.1 LytR C-terminal domain-containing protein [Sinomonas sp. ASV322]